jgi:outer membrane protein assembly factor BamB
LSSPGSLFAVIPTIGLGAPLAILALLFPTVFGGVFVLFRQWMAFITLISLNSTVVLLHWWFAPTLLRGTWWSTDAALWFMMTLFTFVCMIWSWRRQLNALAAGDPDAPRKTELAVLGFMTASCFGATGVMAYFTKTISWVDVGWTMTVVMSVGVFAGAIYRLYEACKGDTVFAAPPLPTEGIILGSMLLGHLAFAPGIWGGNVGTEGLVHADETSGATSAAVAPVVKKWDFTADGTGLFASSPLVDGEDVYAAYSSTSLRVATMVRFDRLTGKKKWEFIGKDGDLVQMISTPCLADGKLYFGEGFHDDKNCRVFCVNAESGEEVWNFKTAGQTESSPAVAHGKVYIGAGNDGVYCLDAKNGAHVWKFPPADYQGRLLRFGAGMLVVGDRLYCGTGVDRNQTADKGETAALCLDAATGKLIWKSAVRYPVWSTPVVKDDCVYLATGNGDVFEDAQPPEVPGGSLVCLDVKSGWENWRFTTFNGIIEAPAIDGHRIYFGCRDGYLYCLNRADGTPRWTSPLGSPIIGTPVLDTDSTEERSFSVFAAASAGKVCCLNPHNGNVRWTYDLSKQFAYISTSPRLAVARTMNGYRWQLYFGCGLGGGPRDVAANRPVFYCLENAE